MDWPFDDDNSTVSVTSGEIVARKVPILYVSHETDEDGEVLWQFHHEPNRFDFATAILVRLDTMVIVDSTISDLGDLPIGWQATRASVGDEWNRSPI